MKKIIDRCIFVINQSQFMLTPTVNSISVDSLLKIGPVSSKSSKILHQSLWNIVTGSLIEYCRIVHDLFDENHPISIIFHDGQDNLISSWQKEDQNFEMKMKNLIACGSPGPDFHSDWSTDSDVPSIDQIKNLIESTNSDQDFYTEIIFVGGYISKKFEDWKRKLEEYFTQDYMDKYHMEFVEITFLDLITSDNESFKKDYSNPVESKLKFIYDCVNFRATKSSVYEAFMKMCENHYYLASTLVQDIPMKEESNTNSGSHMYGVEIIHSREIHDALKEAGQLDSLLIRKDDNTTLYTPQSGFSQTVGIKWVTPKQTTNHIFKFTSEAKPVTLANVSHRASVCLSMFVLGGRSVTLSHPMSSNVSRKFGIYSDENSCFDCGVKSCKCLVDVHENQEIFYNEPFYLTSHGNLMYIHVNATLWPYKSAPKYPIGFLSKDKVDCSLFRINDFYEQQVKGSRLVPASSDSDYTELPIERAGKLIQRSTKYWPLVKNQTCLDNNECAKVLVQQLSKDFLETSEQAECIQAVEKFIKFFKACPEIKNFLVKTEKLNKKNMAYQSAMNQLVESSVCIQIIEINHIVSEFVKVSVDHEEFSNQWIKLIKGSIDQSNKIKIKEIIDYATKYAQTLNSNATSQVNNEQTCHLRNLKFLSNKESSDDPTKDKSKEVDESNRKLKIDHKKYSHDYFLVEKDKFFSLLQKSYQPIPIKKKKLNFEGLTSATTTSDGRIICTLYKNLNTNNDTDIEQITVSLKE